MKFLFRSACLSAALAFAATSASAITQVATYSFNGTLAANEVGAPSLVSIDPLGLNTFEAAVVNGQTQTVFRWSGIGSDPSTQAGLSLNASGLVAYNNYSVEMTFEFTQAAAFGGGWRRIMDTQNRVSDVGFYVDPGNRLQVYPVVTGTTLFTTPGFHTVVLSNFVSGSTQEVKAYLDGTLELLSNTDQLNLDNGNNPGHLLNFFVDNFGSAPLEFANGRIASLKLYEGALVPSPVPEPESAALLLVGFLAVWRAAQKAT